MNSESLKKELERNPFSKLGDVVAQILQSEITTLAIPPASRLNINQIAAELGISRTPVSEAVAKLEALGFVERRPGAGGFHVIDMTTPDMLDLYDARTAIESEAAAICAQTASYEAIARLDAMATAFTRALPRMDGAALRDTDVPFHRLIVETCGNKYIIKSYAELVPYLTMYQSSWTKFIDPESDNPWTSKVVHQHGAIVAAIRMRLPGLARQSMAEHIQSSLSFATYSDATGDPFAIIKEQARKK